MIVADFDFDLFVIGGGSGGVRAARMAGQRGVRIGLAEAGALGGTCVNVGCIPKKLYSYAAEYRAAFEESHGFGWRITELPRLDWAALKRNRAQEITRLNGVYEDLLTNAGVQLLRGRATLEDAHTVVVNGERLRAERLLIATGGWPAVPDFVGHDLVVTSNEMFDLDPFPGRLLVVGGGYIACEFASIFNGLGSRVTQLYRGVQVLRGFDDDVRHFVSAEMVKAGVDLRLSADLRSVVRTTDGLRVTLVSGEALDVDQVLYGTGRAPNVAGLGLERVGVQLAARGAIVVNDRFQSSVPSIYALGDVINRIRLTPVALAEAMTLVDQLFGSRAHTMGYELIPTAVFTHPSIGTVGLSEADARKRFGGVRVYRSEFRALKHTLSGSSERTLMKLVVDDVSDRVVGLHMVGADAGEIVQDFAVALKAGATKAVFDSTVGIHPTSAEEFVTMRQPASAGSPT
jgi:glutathione reductase (NADPH)